MMELDPGDLLLFARVVESGSFSRAADRIGLPKSTVSRRIGQLEAKLGERLLQRTTRKLALTEFGASLLGHARRVVEEVEAAGALAQHRQAGPSGLLRISMPADFADLLMRQVLAEFVRRYPAISLELDLSARRVDLLEENFDLAIRMGNLPDDASLAARRVAFSTLALYASPQYTAVHGLPEHPDDLYGHDLLSLPRAVHGLVSWTLVRGKTTWQRELPVRLLANSPELLIRMACTGVGIAASTDRFATAHLQTGELVRVLPEWGFPLVDAWAVFPGRRLMPAKTRAFLDLMDELYQGDRPV